MSLSSRDQDLQVNKTSGHVFEVISTIILMNNHGTISLYKCYTIKKKSLLGD